jgi:hypothetical protein
MSGRVHSQLPECCHPQVYDQILNSKNTFRKFQSMCHISVSLFYKRIHCQNNSWYTTAFNTISGIWGNPLFSLLAPALDHVMCTFILLKSLENVALDPLFTLSTLPWGRGSDLPVWWSGKDWARETQIFVPLLLWISLPGERCVLFTFSLWMAIMRGPDPGLVLGSSRKTQQ